MHRADASDAMSVDTIADGEDFIHTFIMLTQYSLQFECKKTTQLHFLIELFFLSINILYVLYGTSYILKFWVGSITHMVAYMIALQSKNFVEKKIGEHILLTAMRAYKRTIRTRSGDSLSSRPELIKLDDRFCVNIKKHENSTQHPSCIVRIGIPPERTYFHRQIRSRDRQFCFFLNIDLTWSWQHNIHSDSFQNWRLPK